jgi:tetratricopeptide (TPR) repeat protein/serine/threonine protein kinase
MSDSSLARSAVADRNLLFGILALQLDFIGRDALIASMHAWVLDKSKPLGQILLDQAQLSPERLQLLEALVAEHLKSHHNDPEQSLVALSPISTFPKELSQIADDELQGSLGAVGSARAADCEATLDHHPRPEAAPGTRYRILRFHAKGGLGEVFVAEDQELHREVALKEIQPAYAEDGHSRERFLLEAEITGGLEHPGIVPVYGLGQYGDGRPFYAMRFIKGDNLKDAIRDFHQADLPGRDPGERTLALRQLLGRFIDVCNAVAYAHSRGVLHRDLKPGNIMLGKYGETLVVDWGLAKPVGRSEAWPRSDESTLRPSSASGTAATQLGTALGTPAYMSPEQAAGRIDQLGPASDIYSLGATLYVLLTGQPPFAGENKDAVLTQVPRGEIVPPRRRKPPVSVALEAICLKAMALRPEGRYATALDLATDLEHWLADEPVTAYREPWTARTRRWVRRHRTLLGSLTAALFVALLLGGGGAWWLEQDRAQRRAATTQLVNEALAEATLLRGKARAGPVEDLATWSAALAAARRAEGLLEQGEGSEELLGQVRQLLAELNAEEKDRRLVARLEEVRLQMSDVKEEQFDIARADADYEALFREYGLEVDVLPPEEAAARIRTRSIKEQLAVALDDWAWVRRAVRKGDSAAWKRLTRVARLADPDPWRDRFREAEDVQTLKTLAAETRPDALPAPTLFLLGEALARAGDLAGAVKWFRQAQKRHPGDFWINHQLAFHLSKLKPPELEEAIRFYSVAVALRPQSPAAHLNFGVALRAKGRMDEALAAYREVLRLKKDYPLAQVNLGAAFYAQGQLDEAIAAYREAIRLKKDYPLAHLNLASTLTRKGQVDEGIASYREALRLQKDYPEAYTNLGIAFAKKGQVDEAIAAHQEALRLNKDLPEAHRNLGVALARKGQLEEALAAYREALRLNKDDPETHTNLGIVLSRKGQLDKAIAAHQEAIRLKKDYAPAYNNLGAAFVKKGRVDEAIAAYREALRLQKDSTDAHYNLGAALAQKGQLDEAIAAFREVIRLDRSDAGAHYKLGLVLALKWELDEAIAAYQEAIRLKKDNAEAHYNLGCAFTNNGQLEQAIAAFREAIRLKKDYAEAHLNLGQSLAEKGEFLEGLAALKRGHALGSRNPGWPYPTEEWVRHCERLVELDGKLPAVLSGEVKPAAGEWLEFAEVCRCKRLYANAARFSRKAFTLNPKLAGDPNTRHRYNAAWAAAHAGCGQGAEAGKLDETERTRWRQQALGWLRDDLLFWARQLENAKPDVRELVRQTLQRWQRDPHLSCVRAEKTLAQLPKTERQAWQQLWGDVNKLLQRATDKK